MTIDTYLRELASELPRGARKGRILAEVHDHLRSAAEQVGEREAVARFGEPRLVARGFRATVGEATARLAVLGVLVLAAFPILTYPISENSLPPAPWPEGGMPAHLEWKRDAVLALLLAGAGAAVVALSLLRRGGRTLTLAASASLVILAPEAVLSLLLTTQWREAVPGTPTWLVLVPATQMLITVACVGLAVRAARLSRE